MKRCVVCGKEFEAKSNAAKYCSEKCKNTKIYTKDHVGETWGELTIVSVYRQGKGKYAECLCSCGQKTIVRYDCLLNGNTKSCGHLQKSTQFSEKNYSGVVNKHGIIAIKKTGKIKYNSSAVLECKCTCGNIFEIPIDCFNRIKSCGCKMQDVHKENGTKNIKKVQDKYYIDGTYIANISKKTTYKTNTSGIRGVSWDKTKEKWISQIEFKGKNYYLGRYDKKEDAIKARKIAEKKTFDSFLAWYDSQYKKHK